MITLKCKNCGGEMSVDPQGEIVCPYCGSKTHLSDIEFKEYKQFRLNILNYLRAAADAKASEEDGIFLWNYHSSATYVSADGTNIHIRYLFYTKDDGVESYVAKESVVLVFSQTQKHKADRMLENLHLLQYPSADMKNLGQYFPRIKSRMELNDGGVLIAIEKPVNVYPLYAFGNLRPQHVAWIVSRMENFCCVFEYSDLVQNGISIDSVYINPKTHEAYLYGGWWNAASKGCRVDVTDLKALRHTADRVMGNYRDEAPKQFISFIKNAPADNAYDDFGLWDRVIEEGFGGHHFVKFSSEK